MTMSSWDVALPLVRPAAPADARAIAQIQIDAWRIAYRHIFSAKTLDGMSLEAKTDDWHRTLTRLPANCHARVALVGRIVAGYTLVGPERTEPATATAEIHTIYVAPQHQGMGLGRLLLAAAAHALHADGHRQALVWTLTANHPAQAFYQRLGAEPVPGLHRHHVFDGVAVSDMALRWRSLAPLADPNPFRQ